MPEENEDVVLTDEQEPIDPEPAPEPEPEPEPRPTPEEEEEWERERQAAWDAKIKPFRDLKTQISDHDDLMADALYEITLLELGMEE